MEDFKCNLMDGIAETTIIKTQAKSDKYLMDADQWADKRKGTANGIL